MKREEWEKEEVQEAIFIPPHAKNNWKESLKVQVLKKGGDV